MYEHELLERRVASMGPAMVRGIEPALLVLNVATVAASMGPAMVRGIESRPVALAGGREGASMGPAMVRGIEDHIDPPNADSTVAALQWGPRWFAG